MDQRQSNFGMFAKILAATTLCLATACGGPLQTSVKKQWAQSVQNYSLIPVYPMREDVFIGTLRLKKKTESDDFLNSRSLGYIDMSQALLAEEAGKPTYGKSGTLKKITDPTSKEQIGWEWSQPNSSLRQTGAQSQQRLRLSALPGISMVRLSEADLSQSGIAGLVAYAVAGRAKSGAFLNINLSGIETLEVDDVTALRVVRRDVVGRLSRDQNFRDAICAGAIALDTDLNDVQISMVTRVFYARGINYSWGNSASAALGATVGAGSPPTLDNNTTTDADAPDGGTQKVASVNITPISPGTSTGLASSSENRLTQNEVFDRPLAFGVQSMDVDPAALGMVCINGSDRGGFREDSPLLVVSSGSTTESVISTTTTTATSTSTTLGGQQSCEDVFPKPAGCE